MEWNSFLARDYGQNALDETNQERKKRQIWPDSKKKVLDGVKEYNLIRSLLH